jgi:3'(2'), 5'-bisphosphate nucleotidase
VAEEDSAALRENDSLRRRVVELVRDAAGAADVEAVLDAIDAGIRVSGAPERFWTLDPIDGTKGFLRGDQYAVALALIEGGEVALGVLGCPNLRPDPQRPAGVMAFAARGQGAFLMHPEDGARRPISVDKLPDAKMAKFCESVESAHAAHDVHARITAALGIAAPPYRIDSQAKYAAVAMGAAHIYLRLPRSREYREKIWDHAAGAAVVEAAGGRVSDFSGRRLDFSFGRTLSGNQGILATNGALHDRVLAAIAATTSTEPDRRPANP